ncbi:pentatricopeptide repeat-containing protein At4g01030, mitochondrial [Euphorbia lathyris]|uniref:pentatricopeptide repeat-containing protein At4g01030, mitochondrial n=1 Tax=Euphorbia lathyris TaxID=212925 RepID=UPI0033140C3E
MDKIAPFHRLHNSPLNPNPLTQNPNSRTHLPASLSLAPTSTFPDFTPLSASPLQASEFHSPNLSFSQLLSDVKTLNSIKTMHAQMLKTCDDWSSDSMAQTLITSYLKVRDFRSAAIVFFMGFESNYAMWNSFLEEFGSYGGNQIEILHVVKELHSLGVMFDSRAITVILKFCTVLMELQLGLEVHASLIKRGLEFDKYTRSAVLNYYERCWSLEIANKLFDEIPKRDDLLWNEAIILNLKNDRFVRALQLFIEMQISFAKVYATTLSKILRACGKERALDEGKQIHGYVIKQPLESSNLLICNSLIGMYSRNGKLKLARKVFDSMKEHNLYSWNSIISSYAALGNLNDAWNLFQQMESCSVKPDLVTWNCLLSGHAVHGFYKEVFMILSNMQVSGFRPDSSSITSVLQAVIELRDLKLGKEIHGYVIRNGLDYDVYVGTSLLDMYVKCDCLTFSRAIFDNMKNKNIVAWNSLITGYAFKGLFEEAKALLTKMEEEGIRADLVTWNSLVSGYAIWGYDEVALGVIQDVKRSGLTPNVVSWTALISGSSQNGNYRESLQYFIQMQRDGIKPNSATISSLLRTCGGLSLLHKGKELHCVSSKSGIIGDVYIATSLIDMYCKAGDLKSARKVFRGSNNKTLACWNCMIMGFAIYGLGREAISLFGEMKEVGIEPDSITFTALLSACKNSGLTSEGWNFFDCMNKDYGIVPRIEHYSCMVDLLGRAGYLDEAWDFIQTMPLKPDATIWGAFLGCCRIHTNLEFAEIAAEELFKLEPHNSANYVLMMNLYAMSNRWEDMERIRDLMAEKGVRNREVWSWIQIDNTVHVFSAEGKPHQDEGEIYFELYQLILEMKKLGYTPDISCINQNIDEGEKEKALLSHTEKLAITYGLIKNKGREAIRVIKNTRICSDCHTAAKFMSVARSVEIFVRDGVRFHHFKEGKCSCNDFW